MCGNCLLQETAFICPMECPKGLRNGPCGGSTPERCYVDKTRPCIWYEIFERSWKTKRQERLIEVLPPLDWLKAGTQTWGDVVKQVKIVGNKRFFRSLFYRNKERRKEVWESVFRPVRQPEWWNGDSLYHPPSNSKPVSLLEERLKNGEFVFTTEIIPPQHAGTDRLRKSIETVKPYVSAINFTDNSSSIARTASIICCKVASELGAEPVLQIPARDNNRYSLESKAIGANALGIRNILCITGDNPVIGPPPAGSMEIVDMDSVQMLWLLRKMRDEGKYLDGREIKQRPEFFLGAAASPFASKPEYQALREHKKVNAGAQFLQTNLVFESEGVERWLEQLYKRDILNKVYIIIGIAPLRSIKMANHLNNEIPGVFVPDKILRRMEKAGNSAQEEGITIALELIAEVRKMQGVNGIHLTTMGYEDVVERIIRESGINR